MTLPVEFTAGRIPDELKLVRPPLATQFRLVRTPADCGCRYTSYIFIQQLTSPHYQEYQYK